MLDSGEASTGSLNARFQRAIGTLCIIKNDIQPAFGNDPFTLAVIPIHALLGRALQRSLQFIDAQPALVDVCIHPLSHFLPQLLFDLSGMLHRQPC